MKFKTKEEILSKCNGYCGTTEAVMVRKAFNSFKERINFYKKYSANDMTDIKDRDNLRMEQEDIFDEWFYSDEHKTYASSIGEEGKLDNVKCNELYNKWLFDYCFGDLLE